MSFLGKIMESMRLTDDDDDDYFFDEEEDGYEEEKPPKRKFFSKKEEEYDDDYDDYEEPEHPRSSRFSSPKQNPKVVSMKKPQMQVEMLKPTTVEDAKAISDSLKAGKTVLINMEGIHTDLAQRIIDFTCGATYSMSGVMQKITNYIYVATPQSVELSGDFQVEDIINNSSKFDASGLNIRM